MILRATVNFPITVIRAKNLLQMTPRFSAIPIKIPVGFFIELAQILKFYGNTGDVKYLKQP